MNDTEKIREALSHPKHALPLPMNEVIELRMPERIYQEALAALDRLERALTLIAEDPYPRVPNYAAQIVARNALQDEAGRVVV